MALREQLASKDLGERYIVGRFSTRWCVEDVADRSLHSTHADEFDALLACAKANRNYRQKRGWST